MASKWMNGVLFSCLHVCNFLYYTAAGFVPSSGQIHTTKKYRNSQTFYYYSMFCNPNFSISPPPLLTYDILHIYLFIPYRCARV